MERLFRPLAEVSGSTGRKMPVRTTWTETPANDALMRRHFLKQKISCPNVFKQPLLNTIGAFSFQPATMRIVTR